MAVMDLPAGYGDYPEHEHAEDGQQEVYLALRGSGEIEIEGERHPLDQNTMVRVTPARSARSGRARTASGCSDRAVPGEPYAVPEFTELGTPDPMAQGTS